MQKFLSGNKETMDVFWALGLIGAVFIALTPEAVFAQNAIESTVCAIVGQLAGPVGRAVAAVAVIFLGFSLFMGKVTWGLALALGIGIAAIFGAPEIVDMLGGDGEACPEL
jgi:type IV secretion system protein VirB2